MMLRYVLLHMTEVAYVAWFEDDEMSALPRYAQRPFFEG